MLNLTAARCRMYTVAMQVLLMRLLAVFCSLMLAMPQGWCCFVAYHCTAPAESQHTKQKTPCCPCCPQPADSDEQAPSPQAPFPLCPSCSCVDRQAILPDSLTVQLVETGFVLFLPPLPLVAPDLGHPALVAESADPPPTPSLQVLYCVWRC